MWSNGKAHVNLFNDENTKFTALKKSTHIFMLANDWIAVGGNMFMLLDPLIVSLKTRCVNCLLVKSVEHYQLLCAHLGFSIVCLLLDSCFHTLFIKNITLFTSEMFGVYIF